MGVLKFFHHIAHKYPECLVYLIGNYSTCKTVSSEGIKVEWLPLDLNAIYHAVAQEVYKYGSKAEPVHVSLLKPNRNKFNTTYQPPEKVLFQEICKRIEELRRIAAPSKGIYLATDGVAGVSKMSQQRKRRFKACLDAKKSPPDEKKVVSDKFSSNCISCGTLFMERLSKYIDRFVQLQMMNNDNWAHLEVIISNHRVAGEGEHKFLSYLRKNPKLSSIICSPDADLIFLAAGLHGSESYIFRENIFDDIEADFFLVDIKKFRECILRELKLQDESDQNKKNKAIEDFITYCFFIGNDFLPQIPSLNISTDGIEIILGIYPKIIKEHGFITENLTFNKKAMKAFLFEMSKIESKMILDNKKRGKARYPDTVLLNHISHSAKTRETVLDFPGYCSEYYMKKMNGADVKTVVHEYLKGMLFIMKYYLQGIPSWIWCYPFMYAPFFSDMYEHIDSFDINYKFELSKPLSPLEQLVAILPGASSDLLPECLRSLSTVDSSPIIDMFPTDFEVDLEGKKQEYEAVVLLPHASADRISKAFKSLEGQLCEYDQKRNISGKIFTYYIENNQVIQKTIK